MRPIAIALAAAALIGGGRVGAAELPPVATLTIPRLESAAAIKLDGKLDEEIWSQAPRLTDFRSITDPEKAASQQTEVRVFYTRQYLYLGFTFHEAMMNRLVAGIPQGQTTDAPINSNGDAAEIFIDIDDDLLHYQQLRFNPRGGKNDNLSTNRVAQGKGLNYDERWNGSWSVATSVAKDRWFGEVRIALASFAPDGVYAGTPLPGSAWRINLCRAEAPHGEFSCWSPLKGGFHQPARFAKVVFGGWEHGEIAVDDVKPGEGAIGRNTFSAVVENRAKRRADLKVTLVACEQDSTDPTPLPREQIRWGLLGEKREVGAREFSLEVGQKRPVTFDYEIAFGGPKRLELVVEWKRMIMGAHMGAVRFVTYPLLAHMKRVEADLALIRKVDSSGAEPTAERSALRRGLDEADAELKALGSSAAAYGERIAACEALRQRVAALQLLTHNKVRPADWARGEGIRKPGFVIGLEHPTRKVFRDAPFTGTLVKKARISMALNEYESLQFVIVPLADDVGEVEVAVSTLVHQDDPKSRILTYFQRTHAVGYIDVGNTGHGTRAGAWPDPLYPARVIKTELGRLQPVMYTLWTRPHNKPGLYRGKVVFKNARYGERTVELEAELWPFRLPDRMLPCLP